MIEFIFDRWTSLSCYLLFSWEVLNSKSPLSKVTELEKNFNFWFEWVIKWYESNDRKIINKLSLKCNRWCLLGTNKASRYVLDKKDLRERQRDSWKTCLKSERKIHLLQKDNTTYYHHVIEYQCKNIILKMTLLRTKLSMKTNKHE